ncbi:hypothetical protein GE09DRAFT_1154431 [Coniochaeta sp. 2T2.1]|nr:hypothetical protein GE09DRAFT_1154431 [Coniochaeta sp. 2T2.1]
MLGPSLFDAHQVNGEFPPFVCGGYEYTLDLSYEVYLVQYMAQHYCVILAYDILSPDSWDELVRLHAVVDGALGDKRGPFQLLILGLKSDLQGSGNRVPLQKAKAFADDHGYGYAECSALTGEGVHEAFAMLVERTQAFCETFHGSESGLQLNQSRNFEAFGRVVQAIDPRFARRF